MKKERKPFQTLLLRLILLLLVALGIYLIIIRYHDADEPPALSEEFMPADEFLYNGEPVIQLISRWHLKDNLDISSINRRLPGHIEVLVLNEDITANRLPNYLIIASGDNLPDMNDGLAAFGFTHVFSHLAVYEVQNGTIYPLLTIDHDAIRDRWGDILIDQVTARHGYALVLEPYHHEALYESPVELIEIVMLDNDGREASDDIVIYWDSSESAYKATNTFGAP